MFFEVSKVLGFFALPSNALIFLSLVGVLLMATRFSRAGRRVAAAGIVVLAAAGFLPIGNLLIAALEQRFPRWQAGPDAPTGIVVLGGAIVPDRSASTGQPVMNNSRERIIEAAALAKRYPSARLIYTGGDASLTGGGAHEADFAPAAFERIGVPPSRVEIERRSRNTAENAAFTAEMVKPAPGQRWVLVTSAEHMPRAVGAFRAAGFPVEAYPTGHRIRGEDLLWPARSFAGGLRRLDQATYEWIGMLMYRLTGRSSALFPGPL